MTHERILSNGSLSILEETKKGLVGRSVLLRSTKQRQSLQVRSSLVRHIRKFNTSTSLWAQVNWGDITPLDTHIPLQSERSWGRGYTCKVARCWQMGGKVLQNKKWMINRKMDRLLDSKKKRETKKGQGKQGETDPIYWYIKETVNIYQRCSSIIRLLF